MSGAFHANIIKLAKTSFNLCANHKRVVIFPAKYLKYAQILMGLNIFAVTI